MAKVNFNFQDELGSNLNRYLAKDVTSGIEYTFDLNRKATITKNGTPLNASNLNQLVNAINDNVDEISNKERLIRDLLLKLDDDTRKQWLKENNYERYFTKTKRVKK